MSNSWKPCTFLTSGVPLAACIVLVNATFYSDCLRNGGHSTLNKDQKPEPCHGFHIWSSSVHLQSYGIRRWNMSRVSDLLWRRLHRCWRRHPWCSNPLAHMAAGGAQNCSSGLCSRLLACTGTWHCSTVISWAICREWCKPALETFSPTLQGPAAPIQSSIHSWTQVQGTFALLTAALPAGGEPSLELQMSLGISGFSLCIGEVTICVLEVSLVFEVALGGLKCSPKTGGPVCLWDCD